VLDDAGMSGLCLRAAILVATAAGLGACNDEDIGRCCTVLIDDQSLIPVSEPTGDGDFSNDIARDPAFDCSSFTCVAFRGSEAYCTDFCDSDEDCPEGFECRPVLQSDPPPGSTIGPEDRFCVRPEVGAACEE